MMYDSFCPVRKYQQLRPFDLYRRDPDGVVSIYLVDRAAAPSAPAPASVMTRMIRWMQGRGRR